MVTVVLAPCAREPPRIVMSLPSILPKSNLSERAANGCRLEVILISVAALPPGTLFLKVFVSTTLACTRIGALSSMHDRPAPMTIFFMYIMAGTPWYKYTRPRHDQ